MPLLLDWFMQVYFPGHISMSHVPCMFFTFLMILSSLLNALLKLLNTASEDDYGFASERPSEASEHSFWRWFWVRFWTPFWSFWTTIRTFWSTSELTFWSSELVSEFNVLWFLVSWYGLNFVCVLVNNSRTHKYQELSKSINHLITIDAFNDFLIQSQNHYKICSCHICSCMFLVWTLIYEFALMNLLSNLLNSFLIHTYELQNISSGLLPFWRLYCVLNILMSFNILNLMNVVYLFPSKTTWSI